MNKYIAILFCCTLVACQENKNKSTKKELEIKADSIVISNSIESISKADTSNCIDIFCLDYYIVNKIPQSSECSVINEDCVVFVYPDSAQIAKMKGKTAEDEENFYIAADDNNFYQYQASMYLDSIHVKKIYPKTRYLKFVSKNDTLIVDTKSSNAIGWMTIMFATSQIPKIVSGVEFEKSYSEYTNNTK